MGRVFDAMRRSSATPDSAETKPRKKPESSNGAELRAERVVPSAQEVEEQLFSGSSIFKVPEAPAHSSASTAHTADTPDGSALPGGMASRAAGATLDAAGATRAAAFVSYDISAARVEPHLVAVTQPHSAYSEQFRSLRTRILQAAERENMRVFVVTSAGIGEGKTLTALNLAWLLAQTEGVRALIIDSDLRQPCATEYLDIDAPFGLSDVLAGKAGLQQSIVRLNPAGLYLLPGGHARHDVAELLSGPTFESVIKEARRMFDYVIIDAPPLGIFTDANLLISRADAALLVVRSGKTKYAVLDRLLEQLPRERLLGVVLNRADQNLESSAYYYQQYYRRDRNGRSSERRQIEADLEGEAATVN